LLTIDRKRTRMRISQACLARFFNRCKQNKMDSKRRFITVDKTGIHHYLHQSEK
ncbi:hypothetical protein EAI_00800, partial [Harpegnathos saltator]